MAYGFLMAPVQHKWFSFLSKTFPLSKGNGTVPALKRVAFDQFLFAPVGLGIFFTFMTIAEGGGKRAIVKKFQDVYVPALKANYMVWPAVQILNFRAIPLQFQIVSLPSPLGLEQELIIYSLLSRRSGLPGRHTSPSRTLPMRSDELPHLRTSRIHHLLCNEHRTSEMALTRVPATMAGRNPHALAFWFLFGRTAKRENGAVHTQT